MKLDKYLEEYGATPANIARKANVSLSTVWYILKGKKDILLSIAIRIEDATKGLVKCRDLLSKALVDRKRTRPSPAPVKKVKDDPKKSNKKKETKRKVAR